MYIALIWNPEDAQASAATEQMKACLKNSTRGWDCQLNVAGMMVFDRRSTRVRMPVKILPEQSGVILGRIFPASLETWSLDWKAQISKDLAQEFVATGGRKVFQEYWGAYIVFLCNSKANLRYVARDSSGALPCYHTKQKGVEIVFADVADVDFVNGGNFDVDWRYLAPFIYFSELQTRLSGLKEVYEVLAGEAVRVDRNGSEQVILWDPNDVCLGTTLNDPIEAIAALQFTTQTCVDAWASTFENIGVSLSGGLDSAVILGLLSRSPKRPSITCVNRYAHDVRSDERQFARAAANRANATLLEIPFQSGRALLDDRVLSAPKTVKPTVPYIFGFDEFEFRSELLTKLRSEVLWTGQGGDHLFFQFPTTYGAADYFQNCGIRVGLMRAVRDAARMGRESYWSVIREAWELRRHNSDWIPNDYIRSRPSFLIEDALSVDPMEYTRHPWTRGSRIVPKGKQYQIRLLSELVHRHRPMPGAALVQEHHPLISQPLVELCLKIPNYLLTVGGKQRALARMAFREVVPDQIIGREGKGGTAVFVLQELHKCDAFIRDLLFGGELARQGLLNVKAVEPILYRKRPTRGEELFPLVAAISAEVWIRRWSTRTVQAAA